MFCLSNIDQQSFVALRAAFVDMISARQYDLYVGTVKASLHIDCVFGTTL